MNGDALAERLEEMRDSLATFTDGMKAAARDGALADIAALTEAATRLRAVAGEPVAHQFQDADGRWHGFHSDKHRDDTIADGSWPIRALYTHPQPATPATVTDEDVERITDVFLAHTGQAHKVTQLQRDLARPCMRAALESFVNKEPTDE